MDKQFEGLAVRMSTTYGYNIVWTPNKSGNISFLASYVADSSEVKTEKLQVSMRTLKGCNVEFTMIVRNITQKQLDILYDVLYDILLVLAKETEKIVTTPNRPSQ